MKFNEKLQKMRKEKGLSQEALAEVFDVSRQTISKWESGQSYPETDKLIIISEMFGVTIDSLLKDGETQSDGQNTYPIPFWITGGGAFEYKSKQVMYGLPLVHINIGWKPRKAKGILAIGNIATGFLSIGLIAKGLLSIGLLSMGIISIGVLSLALLLAVGSISIGTFSLGAVAVGIFTLGAVSVGVYSVGAVAAASRVAIGEHAYGHIAIGRVVDGVREFIDTSARLDLRTISGSDVRKAILEEYPNTRSWIISWLTSFLGR
jgi:transcriptional regulator with XRE-family HTH domain